jgi:hypothetical protein
MVQNCTTARVIGLSIKYGYGDQIKQDEMTGLIAGREEMRNVCKTVFGKLKMY